MTPKRVNNNWPVEQRVAAQLVRVPSGCLEWSGKRDPNGYGRAKLSDERARELMLEVAALPRCTGGRPAGAPSQRQIALKYGVSPSLISRILVGKCRVECL